jgi:hypothetical protein
MKMRTSAWTRGIAVLIAIVLLEVVFLGLRDARANDEQVDQEQTYSNGLFASANGFYGQQFTAGINGNLTKIEVLVACVAYGEGTPTLSVYPGHVVPYTILPVPLYSKEVYFPAPSCSENLGSNTWITMVLSDPVPITSGGKYTFVVSGLGGQTNHPISFIDRYFEGAAFAVAGSYTWDIVFRTWGTIEDTDIQTQIDVQIDIKPGSDTNCFNNDDHGVIPVAIMGSATLDATQIDPATVTLQGLAVKSAGKSNKLLASIEDVNKDGFNDLVVKIEDKDGTFVSGAGTAKLTGNLYAQYGGTAIEGSDDICVVP